MNLPQIRSRADFRFGMMSESGERGHDGDAIAQVHGRVQAEGRRAVQKSGTTYAEVARGLGCDAGSLSDWVKKADAAGPAPDANPFQMAEDLRRLRRENERLKRESEIL